MKNWSSVLIAAALVLSLTACSDRTAPAERSADEADDAPVAVEPAVPSSQPEPEASGEPEPSEPEESEPDEPSEPDIDHPLPDVLTIQWWDEGGAEKEAVISAESDIERIMDLFDSMKEFTGDVEATEDPMITLRVKEEQGEYHVLVHMGTPASLGEEVTIVRTESSQFHASRTLYQVLLELSR